MKIKKIPSSIILIISCLLLSCNKEEHMRLIYQEPAQNFGEAIPLGNGRLGAMVYGGISEERLSLNDDTFWSGEPKDWNNPGAKKILPQIKAALEKGNHELADLLAMKMQGPYNQSYQPLEDIIINFEHTGKASDYIRDLDLNNALAYVSYKVDDITYKRTYFSSYPDQALVVRLESDQTGSLNFGINISGKHQKSTIIVDKNLLEAKGKAPMHVDPSYLNTPNPVIYAETAEGKGTNYTSYVKVINEDGEVKQTNNTLQVKNATKATIYITARTSYNGFDKSPSTQGINSQEMALNDLKKLENKTYDNLLKNHVADYKQLFNRVDFKLGEEIKERPMKKIFEAFENKEDNEIAVLAFQMGRYMAIAGSRPGSQALNLQGIWNEAIRPPWSSNYTININTQMNYWPILPTNLAECNKPLLQLIEEVAQNGTTTAQVNYGCNGWVAHHNVDLWKQSAPVGDGSGQACWANFTGGGTWLTMHLWEYYQFTQDKTFLKEKGYPLLKGAVEFTLDWLEQNDEGYYVPPFSVSTEAYYITPDGYEGNCAKNAAEDIALNGELLINFIATCDTLSIKDELYNRAKHVLNHLGPYWIDPEGKIQEWMEKGLDRPKEFNKNHLSHLIGFHPGRHLIMQKNQSYIDAVKQTLNIFGPGSSGWSLAWPISFWARLQDADKSYEFARRTIDTFSPNLFSGGAGFQIDANMGYVAGVCEMLVQSHNINEAGQPIIELLPALPKEWATGHIYGLRTRGGFEVDMEWEDGKIINATIENVCNNTSPAPTIELVVNEKHSIKQIPYKKKINL